LLQGLLVGKDIIIISGGRTVDGAFLKKHIGMMGKPLIVCCDGGARHLRNLDMRPDVIIGDMDSIVPSQLEQFALAGTKIITYPAHKDYTDTQLALDYALGLKPGKIFIWCALGGRMDHALANIFLLYRAREKKIKTVLMDEYCEAFVPDKKISFLNEQGKTVSLLALTSRVTGLTLSGFAYPLVNGTLKMGESLGISNVIHKARASIQMGKGNLLVIKYHRKDRFPEAI